LSNFDDEDVQFSVGIEQLVSEVGVNNVVDLGAKKSMIVLKRKGQGG